MKEKEAYFKLLFDMNGEAVGAELTELGSEMGCILKQSSEEVTPDFLAKKFSEHKKFKAVESSMIKLSGSPNCIIIICGWPICFCCPHG